MVVSPRVRGKHLFFNTLIPSLETCLPQGNGWLMVAKQVNGGEPDELIFDINNDGVISDLDKAGDHNSSGMKMAGIPAGSYFLHDIMYTSDDEGNIDSRKVSVGNGGGGRRLSWQEITQ